MYLQLHIFRIQYTDERISAIIVDISTFTPSEMWSRSYTMYLQLHIFRIQYTDERISAIIVDISTVQYALYCKLVAKYSAHPPVNAMQSVAPDIYNAFTAPHIQASIFN
jgi:hypothetical protein